MSLRRLAPTLPAAALLAAGLLATVSPGTSLAAIATYSGKPPVAPTAAPKSQTLQASCNVNARSAATTSASIITTIPSGSLVTAIGTVSGGSWAATCGTYVSGSSWYRISAINGIAVSSLYGVDVVYAATGLFGAPSAAVPGRLEGIDISWHQGAIDFAKVKAAGKRFVIAKATEGIGYADSMYTTYRAGAMASGLAFTAYHFARPDLNPGNPTGEADWFVNTMAMQHGMLVPALDLEKHGTLTSAQLTSWVQAFLARVYARTGVRAMIYTSPSFWRTYMADTRWFADNGYTVLWVAHWTTASSPSVPAQNWGGKSWTFWQYADCGSVAGVTGCVDLDRFNGSNLTSVTW